MGLNQPAVVIKHCEERSDYVFFYQLFSTYKNFYDFFDAEKVVDSFLNAFERSFVSDKKLKFQGYTELINYQSTEIIKLESKRVWLTDVFTGKYCNQYFRGEIRANFQRRVIVNGATGSSWQCKRFDKISIIVTDVNQLTSLLAS